MLSLKNTQILDSNTHLVSLITPELLLPSRPEQSRIFERSAFLQDRTDCRVTLLHITPIGSLTRSVEESLALKVLTRRVNRHFGAKFESRTVTTKRTTESIERVFNELDGDLLVQEYPSEPGDREDKIGASLIEDASCPIWYINHASPIEEVSARVETTADMDADDSLSCDVAQSLGHSFQSHVGVVSELPADSTDLVITCVPSESERPRVQVQKAREDALQMLKSSANYDLLIHRGCADFEIPRAA